MPKETTGSSSSRRAGCSRRKSSAASGAITVTLGGERPPVTQNDLRGHSGVIADEVTSNDPLYNNLSIDGVSANVADANEPAVVISTATPGLTVGARQSAFYEVSLSKAPFDVVNVGVVPSPLTDEEAARHVAPLLVGRVLANDRIDGTITDPLRSPAPRRSPSRGCSSSNSRTTTS